jgi:hypothetical protein
MSSAKIMYFGYGANRDLKAMETTVGSDKLVGRPAVLKGYSLCVQRMDQVPDTIFETSPVPISPRALLKETWPDDFESYTIKPDPQGEVSGMVWELTPEEMAFVEDLEMYALGWFIGIKAEATMKDGTRIPVQTEGLREGQEVDRVVDGINYETWVHDRELHMKSTIKARAEYLERISRETEKPSLKEAEK